MSRKQILYGLLLLLFSLTVSTAFADDGVVVRSGEVVGDDIATRDNLVIEAGAVVNGDVNILGGNATISGTVNGDVFIMGGDAVVIDSADIQGDCFVVGGTIHNLGANPNLNCSVVGSGADIDVSRLTDALPPGLVNTVLLDTDSDEASEFTGEVNIRPTQHRSSGGGVLGAIISSFGLGALAFLVTMIAPRHVDRIGDAITAKPIASGTVGVLTFISTLSLGTIIATLSSLLVVVCVGLLGFPLVFALAALLIGGIAVGWTAVGTLFGELIADRLNLGWTSLPLTAAVGTLLLSLAIGLVGWFSWGGFATVIGVMVSLIGLGATALTKFGTLPYPRVVINPAKEDYVMGTTPE